MGRRQSRGSIAIGPRGKRCSESTTGIKDFSADFVHTYRGGVLNQKLTERGRLLVKKPGKMRWEYTAPERKLFVSDGVKFYSYLPDDKQVIMSTVPADDEAATPALFLAGKGNLTRDFVPSFADVPTDLPAGARGLKLAPKTPQPDYDWLMLAVEPSTLALKGLVTVDAPGRHIELFVHESEGKRRTGR